MVTIVTAALFAAYMLLDPGKDLASFMQLTTLSMSFKSFILVLAGFGFVTAWLAERKVFPRLAMIFGMTHDYMWPHLRKRRKAYKLIHEKLRM